MSRRPHVTLREPGRRRHRVTVGQQQPSIARVGDGDDFSQAFTLCQEPWRLADGAESAADHEVAGKDQTDCNRRRRCEQRDPVYVVSGFLTTEAWATVVL